MKPEDRITENIPLEMRALVLDGVGFEHLAVRKVPVDVYKRQPAFRARDWASTPRANARIVIQF